MRTAYVPTWSNRDPWNDYIYIYIYIYIYNIYSHFTDPCQTRLTRSLRRRSVCVSQNMCLEWMNEWMNMTCMAAPSVGIFYVCIYIYDGDLCVCHGKLLSLTCIGAKSLAIPRILACFREDSTDFELSVRGHFTDSCETKLFKMLVINTLWYFSFGDSLWNSMKIQ